MTDTKSKQFYVAGPMTGLPQFNIPAFEQAAKILREKHGLSVTSPVELDSKDVYTAEIASPDGRLDENDSIAGETWGEILARDVHVIADHCDAIVVLPDWYKSRGARLEVFVGLLKKLPIYALNGEELYRMTLEHVVKQIARSLFK